MENSRAVIPFSACNDLNVVFRDSISGAVILFDRENKQLSLYRNMKDGVLMKKMDTTFCPLCYRPFHSNELHETLDEFSQRSPSFINSEYFRFLEGFYWDVTKRSSTPSSFSDVSTPEIISFDSPSPKPTPLSSLSFNQGYFKRFFISEGLLGRGSRGEVLKVLHVLDGVPLGHYAVKRIPVGDSHSWLKKLLKEVHLLRLRHTNLVHYNHVWLENSKLTKFGPSVPVLYILQEYCDRGDLESYLQDLISSNESTLFDFKKKEKRLKGRPLFTEHMGETILPLEMIFSFIKDIASGLTFLHENDMIHRDLKPGNCLLQSTKKSLYPRALVSDFGESQVATEVDPRSGGTGTLEYTAPEVLLVGEDGKLKGFFTPASDVFSLGLILYWLLFPGKLPYKHSAEEYDNLRLEILNFKGYQHDYKNTNFPEYLYKFLETMLSSDPYRRPSSQEVLAFMIRVSKEYTSKNDFKNDELSHFNEFEKSRIVPVLSQENFKLEEAKFASLNKQATIKKNKVRF
ncbi:hypothetical protein T552_00253 [Pneumocystis carinii B80]|uniref:non-specific serine/threonine protein kinase n=1 Tax=Pneumocystis carinii (strain B80) TaxID=1408658 RepID=A0A0W4ZTB0_PNEC8|nr:hypothetical protein T552_00253 [Pneumocystis carinii B80]KTW31615.1 hypothetical protein T552_00253 [Pneumocystis carinii B80]